MLAGSLFSGIGGFELGLLWSGLITDVAWQVEFDPFPRSVLARHFPTADRSITDVHNASKDNLRDVGLICFGYPCQDLSGAGKGAGLTGIRSGLWFEGLRVVAELEPRVVLVENVASGARRWVCPVRGGLEALGYRTRARMLGVDDCGGPHRRKRIFVLAYADGGSGEDVADTASTRWAGRSGEGGNDAGRAGSEDGSADVADSDGFNGHARRHGDAALCGRQSETAELSGSEGDAGERQAESGLGGSLNGLPSRVDRWPSRPSEEQHSWEPPRTIANVHHRAARLKALGNAVSPVVAYHVGLWARRVLGI